MAQPFTHRRAEGRVGVVVGLQQGQSLVGRITDGFELLLQAPDVFGLLVDDAQPRVGLALHLVVPPVAVGKQAGEIVGGAWDDAVVGARQAFEHGAQCRRLRAEFSQRVLPRRADSLAGRFGRVGLRRHSGSFAGGLPSAPAPNGATMSDDVADR